jgi:N-acetylated-alpha-linked acidic dipeptidase
MQNVPTSPAELTAAEQALVDEVSLTEPWELVERFMTLVRESGTEEEATAVSEITKRLDAWGIPYEVHRPELFISLPRGASLTLGDETLYAKTPAMALSTGPEGVSGELIYEPASYARDVTDIFGTMNGSADVAGKLVLTEGMPMPNRIADLTSRGAVGVVFIAPGERIHEGICTSIWGAPDLTSMDRQPSVPVVSISHPDGEKLVAQISAAEGGSLAATIVAEHDTRWRQIPVVVAEITGNVEPERFVLVHGHLDSWHVGAGDNATGDATLLELARTLHLRRADLPRSVRIAWWSGHSHGRYAGSTWYAQEYALDLLRNCVLHLNCDSPGCRDADTFIDQSWMPELAGFAAEVISDIAGLPSEGGDPHRAGDNSFNNLGVSTAMMLSSTMSRELRAERGLYAVGGCGANIEWHTEADTIEVADRDRLLRDMRIYATLALRAATAPVLPLDFTATLDEIEATLADRRDELTAFIDLAPIDARLKDARAALATLTERADTANTVQAARPVNDALLRIGRALVTVLYAREGRFRQDPALNIAPLPDFATALEMADSAPAGVIRTELARARNRLEAALYEVIDAVG